VLPTRRSVDEEEVDHFILESRSRAAEVRRDILRDHGSGGCNLHLGRRPRRESPTLVRKVLHLFPLFMHCPFHPFIALSI
jgi:hypothetical protein